MSGQAEASPSGSSAAPPLISVCILAGHGVEAIDACLGSLQAQVSPPPFELLVGGNPTPDVISAIAGRFPHAEVCDAGQRLPGAARNPLIERAQGELLLFLDDDVTVRSDLLSKLSEIAARYPDVSVFGGPNDTPPDSSRFQAVQGAVLSSLIGAGPVSRRYGARHAGPADERWFTLCNLAVRRRVMLPFLRHLVCAEENALLAELRRSGERMRYEPSLRVFHARRGTPGSFVGQMLKYGRGRGELIRRSPDTLRLPYLTPSVLLLYLLLVLVWIPLGLPSPLLLGPAALYAALLLAGGLRIGWTLRNLAVVPLAITLNLTVHLVYGAGVIRGLVAPAVAVEEAAAEWSTSVARAAVGPAPPEHPHASPGTPGPLVQEPA